MESRKKIIACVKECITKAGLGGRLIRTTLLAGTVFFAATSLTEAHIAITPTMEQVAGEGQIRTEGIAYVATHPGLQLIQDTILKWNPDRLTAYTDDFQRGIRPVHMAMTNEKEVTAYSFAGGHVFISDAMATAFMAREYDPNTGNTYGMQRSLNNGYEIYGHSALAATMAHEYAHWERNYLQREVDLLTQYLNPAGEEVVARKLQNSDGAGFIREMNAVSTLPSVVPAAKKFSYKEEFAADQGSMEFLDNTDVYSPGSLMTVLSRIQDSDDSKGRTLHPTNAARSAQVINHINQLSNGRVQIDEKGRMKLDGKLFMGNGYMPARDDVTSFDRTVFVAGQLAKSVHYGAGTKGNRISAITDENVYKKAGNKTVLIAYNNKNSNRRFLLDKFDISLEETEKIADGKAAGAAKEYKAEQEIVRFLQKK